MREQVLHALLEELLPRVLVRCRPALVRLQVVLLDRLEQLIELKALGLVARGDEFVALG